MERVVSSKQESDWLNKKKPNKQVVDYSQIEKESWHSYTYTCTTIPLTLMLSCSYSITCSKDIHGIFFALKKIREILLLFKHLITLCKGVTFLLITQLKSSSSKRYLSENGIPN